MAGTCLVSHGVFLTGSVLLIRLRFQAFSIDPFALNHHGDRDTSTLLVKSHLAHRLRHLLGGGDVVDSLWDSGLVWLRGGFGPLHLNVPYPL